MRKLIRVLFQTCELFQMLPALVYDKTNLIDIRIIQMAEALLGGNKFRDIGRLLNVLCGS